VALAWLISDSQDDQERRLGPQANEAVSGRLEACVMALTQSVDGAKAEVGFREVLPHHFCGKDELCRAEIAESLDIELSR
jgi:hypothetical protein